MGYAKRRSYWFLLIVLIGAAAALSNYGVFQQHSLGSALLLLSDVNHQRASFSCQVGNEFRFTSDFLSANYRNRQFKHKSSRVEHSLRITALARMGEPSVLACFLHESP